MYIEPFTGIAHLYIYMDPVQWVNIWDHSCQWMTIITWTLSSGFYTKHYYTSPSGKGTFWCKVTNATRENSRNLGGDWCLYQTAIISQNSLLWLAPYRVPLSLEEFIVINHFSSSPTKKTPPKDLLGVRSCIRGAEKTQWLFYIIKAIRMHSICSCFLR